MVFGPIYNPVQAVYTTSTWLGWLFQGRTEGNPILMFLNPPCWAVDVRDTAIIHVAALLANDVNGKRLWAAGHQDIHVNDILAIWRKRFPTREIVPDFDFPKASRQDLDRTLETTLLQRYAGRDWYSLEETVVDNVKALA